MKRKQNAYKFSCFLVLCYDLAIPENIVIRVPMLIPIPTPKDGSKIWGLLLIKEHWKSAFFCFLKEIVIIKDVSRIQRNYRFIVLFGIPSRCSVNQI